MVSLWLRQKTASERIKRKAAPSIASCMVFTACLLSCIASTPLVPAGVYLVIGEQATAEHLSTERANQISCKQSHFATSELKMTSAHCNDDDVVFFVNAFILPS